MPNDILIAITAGAIGGLVRAYLGWIKYRIWESKFITFFTSAIIGAGSALAFISLGTEPLPGLWIVAGLAGYVGTDVVETLYKLRQRFGGHLA